MSIRASLSDKFLKQIEERGKSVSDIETQLHRFRKGFPDLKIDRPATVGDGIVRLPERDMMPLTERFLQAQREGRVMKFVPASGAASRMFQSLLVVANGDDITKDRLESATNDEHAAFTKTFLEHLETYAFYEDLVDLLREYRTSPDALKREGAYHRLLSFVLSDKGLGLAGLPKALIPFHRYADHRRTPLEEHLVEALAYTQATSGHVRIHFTISPEHKEAFDRRLEQVCSRYEKGTHPLRVETSFQKPETDTIAADPDNNPFLDDNGSMVFRPGGHGALLVNLEELRGDVVFIKNIDNVVPDRFKETTYKYKKLIGGYLMALQDKIFFYLKELERQGAGSQLLGEIVVFVQQKLHVTLPGNIPSLPTDGERDLSDEAEADTHRNILVRWLFDRLNRPVRVCGMVINQGEPGGGPFVVRHSDGSTSLQIVESAQVNLDDPAQKKIFGSATHFNPVDLVCSLRDYQGQPFRLEDFRDPETGFISEKSYQGRALKALELPGLWNGSMARWNTVFVEVPADTFHPVKTVNDLLRDQHREE